jgi:hypothetical protein
VFLSIATKYFSDGTQLQLLYKIRGFSFHVSRSAWVIMRSIAEHGNRLFCWHLQSTRSNFLYFIQEPCFICRPSELLGRQKLGIKLWSCTALYCAARSREDQTVHYSIVMYQKLVRCRYDGSKRYCTYFTVLHQKHGRCRYNGSKRYCTLQYCTKNLSDFVKMAPRDTVHYSIALKAFQISL